MASACGYTSKELNEWMHFALCNPGINILAMGDDSIVIDHYSGRVYEYDYSQFDQSQQGLYIDMDTKFLRAMGLPDHVLTLLNALAEARMRKVFHKQNTAITFRPHQKVRKSGGPNTSLSNTMNNWLILVCAFAQSKDGAPNFEGLGVKVGAARSVPIHSVNEATFLRGMWWKTTGNSRFCYEWCYMPSMALKVGKIGRKVEKKRDYLQLVYGISKSFGCVPDDLPILGPMLKKMRELGREGPRTEELLREHYPWTEHRPTLVDTPSLDLEVALGICERRYGLLRSEIEAVEASLRSVQSVPAFVGHSAFERLATDY
jgi:hypothetical protein